MTFKMTPRLFNKYFPSFLHIYKSGKGLMPEKNYKEEIGKVLKGEEKSPG